MLIDELIPDYDVCDRYSETIDAAPEKVWDTVWTFNLCESPVVSWLFWLRGMPSGAVTLADLEKLKFKLIGENRGIEVVFGIIGQFWTINGNLQDFDPAGFRDYEREGFAKCAWSFQLSPAGEHTRLTTETRIACMDSRSRNNFDFYWAFVRPFSGWTRKEMLKTVKRVSESRETEESDAGSTDREQ